MTLDGILQKQFEEDIITSMGDEVGSESHGNAEFMTQDMASNVIGSSSTQVQGEIAPNSSLF